MDRETARDALVFALDVYTLDEARELAERLADEVGWMKLGSRLFVSEGPAVVELLHGLGYKVFVDLKFHDIPNQVKGSCTAAARAGAQMMTVHCTGGRAMLQAAVEGAREGAGDGPMPLVMGVTLLTSMDQGDLDTVGIGRTPAEQVLAMADLAHEAGLGGIVCSPREVGAIRQRIAPPFRLLTPGIRPAGAAADDQARTGTPADAIRSGSDFLVVGRPIRRADDPAAAARGIVGEIAEGLASR